MIIYGTAQADHLVGQATDDEIYGLGGDDILSGGAGDDLLDGGSGRDSISGGDGNDVIIFTGIDEMDDVDGGAGVDWIYATDSTLEGTIYDFVSGTITSQGITYSAFGIEELSVGDTENIIFLGNEHTQIITFFSSFAHGKGKDNILHTQLKDAEIHLGDGDDYIYCYNLIQPDGFFLGELIDYGGIDTIDFSLAEVVDGEGLNITLELSFPDLQPAIFGIENLVGSAGDDTIHGSDDNNVLSGRDGADEIYGYEGNDTIAGGAGADSLHGGDNYTYGDTVDYSDSDAAVTINLGAQSVSGGHAEGDTIDGFERAIGSAFDDLFIGSPVKGVDGGPGSDTLDMSGIGDVGDFHWDLARGFTGFSSLDDPVLQDLASIENFLGSAGPDVVRGTADENFLSGNSGNDRLFGMAGADRLAGGAGNDLLDGGEGNDTADYSLAPAGLTIALADTAPQATGHGTDTLVGIENLIGSGLVDDLAGNASDNRIEGRGGNDALSGGGGADTLLGGEGDDDVKGHKGGDLLLGDAGDDRLYGGAGNDQLFGGIGADILQGHSGDDTLTGGAGDDLYFVDSAGDAVVEAEDAGIDEVRVRQQDYVLPDNVEVLRIFSGHYSGTGNALANQINGSNGHNTILGLGGDDTLRGRGGSDTIDGGDGNDVIAGGAGRDFLTGATGADRFVFVDVTDSTPGATNADVITDFSHAQGDRIQLAAIDAIPGGADDKFAFIGKAAFSGTAGELRYRHEAGTGDTLVEMDIDGDGVRDMTIRLTGTHDLVAGDFVL